MDLTKLDNELKAFEKLKKGAQPYQESSGLSRKSRGRVKPPAKKKGSSLYELEKGLSLKKSSAHVESASFDNGMPFTLSYEPAGSYIPPQVAALSVAWDESVREIIEPALERESILAESFEEAFPPPFVEESAAPWIVREKTGIEEAAEMALDSLAGKVAPALEESELENDLMGILENKASVHQSVEPIQPSGGQEKDIEGNEVSKTETAEDESLFEQINRNRSVAKTFNLGTFELNRRFKDFDRAIESKEIKKNIPPVSSQPMTTELDDKEIANDLAMISRASEKNPDPNVKNETITSRPPPPEPGWSETEDEANPRKDRNEPPANEEATTFSTVVSWAPDGISPTYRHLNAAASSEPFYLTASDLERLAEMNAFALDELRKNGITVKNNETYRNIDEKIIFALRGCQPLYSMEDFAEKVELQEVTPDHIHNRCVIGIWDRPNKKIIAFQGNTVPNAEYMTKQRNHPSKKEANLLATGLYVYEVGTHLSKELGNQPGALLMNQEVAALRVVRGTGVLQYTVKDKWDYGDVGDNIHSGRDMSGKGVEFSSAGCSTLPGWYDDKNEKPLPGHRWYKFREYLGLDNSDPENAADKDKQFIYMILTGREARMVVSSPGPEALTRLRFGSSGVNVEVLQEKLKDEGLFSGGIDGQFERETAEAFIEWQTKQDGTADCIVTPEIFRRWRYDMVGKISI